MSVCSVCTGLRINPCDPCSLNEEEHLLGSSWLDMSVWVSSGREPISHHPQWAAANPKLEPASRIIVVCGVSDHGGKGSPFGAGCWQAWVYTPGFSIARWAHVASAAVYTCHGWEGSPFGGHCRHWRTLWRQLRIGHMHTDTTVLNTFVCVICSLHEIQIAYSCTHSLCGNSRMASMSVEEPPRET